eukprot:1277898-Rhodomonas_salina.1
MGQLDDDCYFAIYSTTDTVTYQTLYHPDSHVLLLARQWCKLLKVKESFVGMNSKSSPVPAPATNEPEGRKVIMKNV